MPVLGCVPSPALALPLIPLRYRRLRETSPTGGAPALAWWSRCAERQPLFVHPCPSCRCSPPLPSLCGPQRFCLCLLNRPAPFCFLTRGAHRFGFALCSAGHGPPDTAWRLLNPRVAHRKASVQDRRNCSLLTRQTASQLRGRFCSLGGPVATRAFALFVLQPAGPLGASIWTCLLCDVSVRALRYWRSHLPASWRCAFPAGWGGGLAAVKASGGRVRFSNLLPVARALRLPRPHHVQGFSPSSLVLFSALFPVLPAAAAAVGHTEHL